MPKSVRIARPMSRRRAFTLIELLVAMAVLTLLVGMIAQMTGGMSSIIGRGQAHIDTDEQARALLDRMAIDFAGMVKRPDVDYYLKGRPAINDPNYLKQTGNDQIAFYSEVPGYFPATNGGAVPGSVSLVAYRVNSATMHLERLSKGLAWNGTGNTMGFLPVPLASPLPSPLPSPMPANVPAPLWPQAASATTTDPDYEELGPQVFRFEYYYVLKAQSATNGLPMLSLTPWYANAPANHTSVNGMQDVAGVGILIAVIDPKSRLLIPKTQQNDPLAVLAGQMEDAPANLTNPGDIEQQWMAALNTSALPRSAMAGVRIYTRCFYLNGVSP